MKKWFQSVNWPKTFAMLLVVLLFLGLVYLVVDSVLDQKRWEDGCYARGGVIVDTSYEEDKACIDSERKLIVL